MVSVTFWQSISLPLHPLMVIKQKKMDNRVKFYSWLISLLERRRLTFEEIAMSGEMLTPIPKVRNCNCARSIAIAKPSSRIRAFYPEYNYIEEVPLHESQERVRESPDGMYREYDLTVRPSYDFLQEMLWHGRNLIVLRPKSLRQEMIAMLKDMTQSYKTGECLNGEE